MYPTESHPQIQLPLKGHAPDHALEALDLFAGIGGLSLGFQEAGFTVVGVDSEPISASIFELNAIGTPVQKDLREDLEIRDVPVVIGGPPCRPWSSVNLQRRGTEHDDHVLLERFFAHLCEIRPQVFMMENVPPISGDPDYKRLTEEMRWRGYSVGCEVLRYSDFGSPTTRKRLFTVGFRDSVQWTADEFFQRLKAHHRPQQTVRQAIDWLRTRPRGSETDHEWSQVKTIHRYAERYRTGQYGWKQLDWDEPAPSFGSVSKTYILHPASDESDFPARVLSVREVLSIMGFDRSFRFPDGSALSKRYRMAANAVSPIVSRACARVIREMLTGNRAEDMSGSPGAGANHHQVHSAEDEDAES